ncbi:MAG: amidohydrolase, partial [Clostridiales bacterium]|nr:amidohydrolase [Clostridiales bacterium]
KKEPIPGQKYGHACGHNLLGVAHVAAVIGLKAEMEAKKLPGTIIYYGCPAEEILTGKGFMARGGAFDGIDASIAFHPGTTNAVTTGNSLALNSVKFHFKGITAHAGGDPHNGRSALDAVELTNVGANYLREHVTTDVRIHYIITEGGTAPNIVPDNATVWYYVRAPKRETVEEVYARLVKVAEGAAHMTETKLEIEFLGGCYQTLNNYVLVDHVHKVMEEVQQEPWSAEEIAFAKEINDVAPHLRDHANSSLNLAEDNQLHFGVAPVDTVGNFGSTDVGDVTYIAPGVTFTTATYAIGAPGHSWQIVACSGGSIGEKGMIYAGKIMAKFGLDLIEQPEILKKATLEFKEKTGGKPYKCPMPKELPVPGQE